MQQFYSIFVKSAFVLKNCQIIGQLNRLNKVQTSQFQLLIVLPHRSKWVFTSFVHLFSLLTTWHDKTFVGLINFFVKLVQFLLMLTLDKIGRNYQFLHFIESVDLKMSFVVNYYPSKLIMIIRILIRSLLIKYNCVIFIYKYFSLMKCECSRNILRL